VYICEGLSKKCWREKRMLKVVQNTFEFTPIIFIRLFDPSGKESHSHLDVPMEAGKEE
jgi:hypothetical protein